MTVCHMYQSIGSGFPYVAIKAECFSTQEDFMIIDTRKRCMEKDVAEGCSFDWVSFTVKKTGEHDPEKAEQFPMLKAFSIQYLR